MAAADVSETHESDTNKAVHFIVQSEGRDCRCVRLILIYFARKAGPDDIPANVQLLGEVSSMRAE
jgi:GTP cyclohydrolase II